MNRERIAALERAIEDGHGNIAGIVVRKDGVTRYAQYFHGFTADSAVHVASVTKSIFSALVGIAVDKGYIGGVGQKVLGFFPDYTVMPGETGIYDVTVEHLLTMTAPYRFEAEPYEAFFMSDDWVKAALDYLGGGARAGTFHYSPIIGAHILSGILTKATGQPVLDFARENLFAPLGIGLENVVFRSGEEQLAWYAKDMHARGWVVDPQGINTASWGLTLTPMDMANIGQLYLDGGRWAGRQLIPAGWVKDSTRAHARWNGLSYGYLWWVIDETGPVYAALGDGGNVIYVNAKKGLVVSIGARFAPDTKDRVALIEEFIEPAFEG